MRVPTDCCREVSPFSARESSVRVPTEPGLDVGPSHRPRLVRLLPHRPHRLPYLHCQASSLSSPGEKIKWGGRRKWIFLTFLLAYFLLHILLILIPREKEGEMSNWNAWNAIAFLTSLERTLQLWWWESQRVNHCWYVQARFLSMETNMLFPCHGIFSAIW